MNDNIVDFPKPKKLPAEFFIEVDLEDSRDDMSIVEAITAVMEMHTNGIYLSSDVEWHHIMDACLNIAISSGLRAGIDAEEMENLLGNISIDESADEQ
jgi:hypothetical protein|tara:strand:- start:1113 stop:1406 length:294 start_codon:yes stop_codon:yes gene_type:complete